MSDQARQSLRTAIARNDSEFDFREAETRICRADDKIGEQGKTFAMEGPPTSEFGVEAMAKILALKEPPSAVIAYNDQLAFGLMSGARDVGLTPGKDIAIVGFDDVRASAVRNVPLTTVSTPPSRIGAELARLLMARIKDGGAAAVNIIPPPRLIIRKSCGAPAAGITRKN